MSQESPCRSVPQLSLVNIGIHVHILAARDIVGKHVVFPSHMRGVGGGMGFSNSGE